MPVPGKKARASNGRIFLKARQNACNVVSRVQLLCGVNPAYPLVLAPFFSFYPTSIFSFKREHFFSPRDEFDSENTISSVPIVKVDRSRPECMAMAWVDASWIAAVFILVLYTYYIGTRSTRSPGQYTYTAACIALIYITNANVSLYTCSLLKLRFSFFFVFGLRLSDTLYRLAAKRSENMAYTRR